MPNITKNCPHCETSIGISEEKCPKCGFDFTLFDEETIANFEKLSEVVARKRARQAEAEKKEKDKQNPPVLQEKRKGFFDSLKGKR